MKGGEEGGKEVRKLKAGLRVILRNFLKGGFR